MFDLTLIFGLICFILTCIPCPALADTAPRGAFSESPQAAYRTPLAGESFRTVFMGHPLSLPRRDRDNISAITLGGMLFQPSLGGQDGIPVAALYLNRHWGDVRARGVFAVFVNEMDVSKSMGQLELLGHLENDTVPFAQTEIVNGSEEKQTSIKTGNVLGWLGAGLRLPVAPFNTDNTLRVQAAYQAGYLYANKTSDSGPGVKLPPATLEHGLHFRIRYDGLRRNIMELPHEGWAAGADLELLRRDMWSDANYGSALFKGSDTRDYVRFSGYLLGAAGIPGLSERNRLIASVHGGCAPFGMLDRFSTFWIGGGPFPYESDDLWRHPYPGATFNQFPVSEYLIGTLEYRRELLFFLYLHLRGTFAWGNRDVLTSTTRHIRFSEGRGQAFSVGLTSGFPWESQLYLEYAHDSSMLRNGASGDSALLLWSKSF